MNKKEEVACWIGIITIFIILIVSVVCTFSKINNQEEEFIGPKFWATKEYFNCSSTHTSYFKDNKPYFKEAIHVTAIEVNSEIIYYINKDMLLQLSEEREEDIVCGRYKPHTSNYEENVIYEGKIERVKTVSCEVGEIGYGRENLINQVYYDIICCIESGYCYKYNPKDSYYKDYDYIKCYSKTKECDKYE